MPAFDAVPAPTTIGEITVSTDKRLIDPELVHGWLQRTHWAEGIPLETVRRSIGSSLCFGAFKAGRQVGFARVITDYATFAYLADVVVEQAERGRGIGRRLLEAIEVWATERGATRLQLVADRENASALRFYERLGWRGTRLVALHRNVS
jgi:GNAT superfamily N-acetyltransferase